MAWGNNASGQLSDGATADRSAPQPATWRPGGPPPAPEGFACAPLGSDPSGERGLLATKVAVAAGAAHTLTLNAAGEVWAWGANGAGQLGDGTYCSRDTQVRAALPRKAVAIAAGATHSLAILDDGSVWAWGLNWDGQLGRAPSFDLPAASPTFILPEGCSFFPPGCTVDSSGVGEGGSSDGAASAVPQQVPGVGNAAAIAAGMRHSMVLTHNGAVVAWGRNDLGQLGIGYQETADKYGNPYRETLHPSPARVWLDGVTSIAAGAEHSLAVTSDGTLWAWGSDNDSQLGDEDDITPECWCRLSPGKVKLAPAVIGVAAGAKHTIAWPAVGPVLAWGDNSLGQLGDGTTWSRHFPFAHVKGLDMGGFGSTRQIVAGTAHSMALNFDGSVTSWGANHRGQLGRSAPDGQDFDPNPRLIPGFKNASALAAGGAHSLSVGGERQITLIFPVEPDPSDGASPMARIITPPTATAALVVQAPVLPRFDPIPQPAALQPTATRTVVAQVQQVQPVQVQRRDDSPAAVVQQVAPSATALLPTAAVVPPTATSAPASPTPVPSTPTAVPATPTATTAPTQTAQPTTTVGTIYLAPVPSATPTRYVIR